MTAVSRFLSPPRALASCVFLAIHRDTRGADLGRADRINYFPASPLPSITVIRHGRLKLSSKTGGDFANWPELPEISVTAPSRTPMASWSPDDVEAVTVAFPPDAWIALGGAPDFSTLPDVLGEATATLLNAKTADDGWREFCAILAPVWRERRDRGWKPADHISDWVRSVMARAAQSSNGRSLRTFERHLKRLSGQSKRELDFFAAFEDLHRIAVSDTDASPSEIAAMAGFADQSHMGRSVRRATGFSPDALNKAIQSKEAFWCYRLLGQRL